MKHTNLHTKFSTHAWKPQQIIIFKYYPIYIFKSLFKSVNYKAEEFWFEMNNRFELKK